jgi:hypothetical protein
MVSRYLSVLRLFFWCEEYHCTNVFDIWMWILSFAEKVLKDIYLSILQHRISVKSHSIFISRENKLVLMAALVVRHSFRSTQHIPRPVRLILKSMNHEDP